MRLFLSAVTAALASACAAAPDQAEQLDPQTAEGRFLVQLHCGDCHAWRDNDASRHAEAPALRTLSQNYPVSSLAEALAEGIMVGHPDMPEFRFRPEDVSAVIAWLEHIQEPR
jgi:mono/diheme cytochrome c family protein